MATIYIYPGAPNTGVDFSAPNAAAYAALAGGGASNTVVFTGGYTYTPEGGKWWGRDQRYGLDKRIHAVISNSQPVWLTGLVYITAGMDAVYGVDGPGLWTVDVIDNSAAVPPGINDECYLGCRYDVSASGMEIGWRYGQASSVGNVGAYFSRTDQRAGKGVWRMEKVGDVVKLYIWSPSGGVSRPEVEWSGVAVMVRAGGAGQSGFCPISHAFVFAGSASNDPSGSLIEGDFRLTGALNMLTGTPVGASSTAYSVSDVTYDGIKMYGSRTGIMLANEKSGAVISGFKWTGGWLYDDRIDPDVYCVTENNDGEFEAFVIEYRVRDTVAENGTIICGISHGLLSWVGNSYGEGTGFDGTGAEESRSSNNKARKLRLIARTGDEHDIRAFAIRKHYGDVLEQCEFHGFSTISKINGKGTKLLLNEFKGRIKLDAGSESTGGGNAFIGMEAYSTPDDGVDDALETANFSCQLLGNTFDGRGDVERGVIDPFACIEMKAQSGLNIPAGAMFAEGNICLGDPGTVALRVKLHSSSTVSSNQTWRSNFYNQAETSQAPEGVSTIGTVQAASTTFSTGTVSGNVTDTAANILARGDLPARALAIGLPS